MGREHQTCFPLLRPPFCLREVSHPALPAHPRPRVRFPAAAHRLRRPQPGPGRLLRPPWSVWSVWASFPSFQLPLPSSTQYSIPTLPTYAAAHPSINSTRIRRLVGVVNLEPFSSSRLLTATILDLTLSSPPHPRLSLLISAFRGVLEETSLPPQVVFELSPDPCRSGAFADSFVLRPLAVSPIATILRSTIYYPSHPPTVLAIRRFSFPRQQRPLASRIRFRPSSDASPIDLLLQLPATL